MKKNELRNGAVVITRNKIEWLKVDNTLLALEMDGYCVSLNDYTEDLKNKDGNMEYDIIKVFNRTNNNCGCCNNAVYSHFVDDKPTWERPEDILDDKEREYLSHIIIPFRDKVKYMCKHYYRVNIKSNDLLNHYEKTNYILIYLENKEEIRLPYFKIDTMYRNMEVDREYTLEELGI